MRTNVQAEFNLWNFCWPSPEIHTKVQVTPRKAGSILNWEERLIASTMWFPYYCCCSVTQLRPTLCGHKEIWKTVLWTAAHQASLSFTISWSLLKLIFIKSVMPSSHLAFCRPLLVLPSIFPSIRIFSNESTLHIRCQSIEASASVLPMNIQDWFPLGLTGWISLQSKGLSRVFSNTTVQKHQFLGTYLSSQSNSHFHTWPLEKP